MKYHYRERNILRTRIVFREYLISKYSTGYSNTLFSLLSGIFKMAVEERVIELNHLREECWKQ